ncbi:btb (poz) domain-containing 2a-related [Anaeramoeba ignava]|uniref:Btb (Poz) domain-containing 2a-related n=1 Tax=Anaeramoeba ignava TaxID=1746090 RepID=A0A9Q0LQM7_ANAIG|nr:btb (poz) domain-containing 2a-related [Anaeramoeba ignava]
MSDPLNLTQSLKKLFNQRKFADVKFIVGKTEKIFYAHKLILSLASDFWKKMFYGLGWKEVANKAVAVVNIPDIDYKIFETIMFYVYFREKNINANTVFQLIQVSDKYLLSEFKKDCLEFLYGMLTPLNCFQYLEDPNIFFGDQETKEIILRFIQTHRTLFQDYPNILEGRMQDTIKEILSLDSFRTKEFILFQSVYNWGKWVCKLNKVKPNKSNLKEALIELIPLIRFNCFDSNELKELKKTKLLESKVMKNLISIRSKNPTPNRRRFPPFVRPKKKEDVSALLLCAHHKETRIQNVLSLIRAQKVKIDVFHAMEIVPDLDSLLDYDVIFFYSGFSRYKEKEMGDVLAEYVKTGRGLVFSAVWLLATDSIYDGKLMGELEKPENQFLPFSKGIFSMWNRVTLDLEKSDKKHFILQDIKSFDNGEGSYYVNINHESGNLIARYNNDAPMIAEKRVQPDWGNVVVINFYPPSDLEYSHYWVNSTDGGKILANCILYAAMF